MNTRWEPLITLISDHLPIIIDLDGRFASLSKPMGSSTYVNFRKSNWERFTRETEQVFNRQQRPSSAEAGEKILRKILQKATKRNIPSGKALKFTPNHSQRAKYLIRQPDQRRTINPTDPHIPRLDA